MAGNKCNPPGACRMCKHANVCKTWMQIQQRSIQEQKPIKQRQAVISLKHVKSTPARFRRYKHTEPISINARVIKVIYPYRVYREEQDGSIHYEIRCNICGAICKNILTLSSEADNYYLYYLGCSIHARKPKYEQLFDIAWPKLQRFLDTTAISEKFIAKL